MELNDILEKALELSTRLEYDRIYESCSLREKKSPEVRPIRNSFYRSNLRHMDPKYKYNMKNFDAEYDDFLGDFDEFEELLNNFVYEIIEDPDISDLTFLDAYKHNKPTQERLLLLNKRYRKYEGYLFKMIFTWNMLKTIYIELRNKSFSSFQKSKFKKLRSKIDAAGEAIDSQIDSFIREMNLIKYLWPLIKNVFKEPLTKEYLNPKVLKRRAERIHSDDLIRITNTASDGFI